jgi:hypothetical protein
MLRTLRNEPRPLGLRRHAGCRRRRLGYRSVIVRGAGEPGESAVGRRAPVRAGVLVSRGEAAGTPPEAVLARTDPAEIGRVALALGRGNPGTARDGRTAPGRAPVSAAATCAPVC